MRRQAIDLEDEELTAAIEHCFSGLKPVFGTTQAEIFIYAGNGHGAWESAIANTMSAGDKVLVPQTGHFSTGWAEMAESFGIDCEILPNDLRVATDPAKIAACLDADKSHKIKAVMQVHTDTSTGVTHDIKAIHEAIAATGHPALYMVDSVAALGTCAFEMDAWGIDVAVTASQKGLMCPPGLGIVAASARALEAHKTSTAPRRYWDWSQRRHTAHYRAFGGTCPEHLIFALDEALRMIEEEGLEAIYRRHFHLAEAVRRAVDVWAEGGALEIHALHPAERSNGVTAIRTAEGIDPVELRLLVRQMMRTSVAGGLGQLRGRAFRIGHLGDLNEPMILGSLAAVETSLEMLDIAHQKGGVTAAIDYIAGIKKTELAAARAALREKAA
jgi:alanine-glyoxylate transaminase/serine-glyoxylate transaminase/serine-pyruvate transaminase